MEQKETEQRPGESAAVSPVKSPQQAETASMNGVQIISFGERITYVFSQGKEVGSVHFDRGRMEIFYKGHNIRNMELEDWQMEVLTGLRHILANDTHGKSFAPSYGKTLDKILLEKKR